MRTAVAATICALALSAAFGLTACGDDQPVDQVPKSTPELLPPDDANELAAGGTGTDTTTSQTTTDATAPDTGGTPATGATPGAGTGGTATPGAGTGGAGTGGTATPGTGGQAAPNPGGVTPDETAGAGSFQGFCDANPGAC